MNDIQLHLWSSCLNTAAPAPQIDQTPLPHPTRLGKPLSGLDAILCDANPVLVQPPQIHRRSTHAPLRSLSIPGCRLDVVWLPLGAPLIQDPHIVLRVGVSSLCRIHPYLERRSVVGPVKRDILPTTNRAILSCRPDRPTVGQIGHTSAKLPNLSGKKAIDHVKRIGGSRVFQIDMCGVECGIRDTTEQQDYAEDQGQEAGMKIEMRVLFHSILRTLHCRDEAAYLYFSPLPSGIGTITGPNGRERRSTCHGTT